MLVDINFHHQDIHVYLYFMLVKYFMLSKNKLLKTTQSLICLDEGFLKSFIESTEGLTPEEKAAKLETDEVSNFSFSEQNILLSLCHI